MNDLKISAAEDRILTLIVSDVFTPQIIFDMQESTVDRTIIPTSLICVVSDLCLDDDSLTINCIDKVEIYHTLTATVPYLLLTLAAEKNWVIKSIPENFTADGNGDTAYLFTNNNKWWIM